MEAKKYITLKDDIAENRRRHDEIRKFNLNSAK